MRYFFKQHSESQQVRRQRSRPVFINSVIILTVFLFAFFPLRALAAALPASQVNVAFAGSMGVVTDLGLGPVFSRKYGVVFQGRAEGAYALAGLLAAKEIESDVFISVGEGPVRVLQKVGLAAAVVPIAATQMVLTYSPESRFIPLFHKVAAGKMLWYKALMQQGVRFGRTDPLTDPQGRNVVLTFLLAEKYYKDPELVSRILGSLRNPQQIFAEPSLLSRLLSGQIDATVTYESAAKSLHLPVILLPQQINLGSRSFAGQKRDTGFYLKEVSGRRLFIRPEPLIFYAVLLKNAPQPQRARQFFDFLQTGQARQIFKRYGYNLLEPSAKRP